jgi:hypothetical protein
MLVLLSVWGYAEYAHQNLSLQVPKRLAPHSESAPCVPNAFFSLKPFIAFYKDTDTNTALEPLLRHSFSEVASTFLSAKNTRWIILGEIRSSM